ncbi:prefoldin subunit 1 isoform X3 [Aphelocoma coerulescens]|uniref:prefoldin subunit 1 isoform X3 n=1 Tax=Aphelocoma coerulescens TaxID=39617 RepID=UPI00360547B4
MRPAPTRWRRPWTWSSRRCETPARVFLFHVCSLLVSHPSTAFTELQAKVMDTQQKVKLADLQIEQLTKTKKHAHLTDTEVMMLVDETRMYEGVGRIRRSRTWSGA